MSDPAKQPQTPLAWATTSELFEELYRRNRTAIVAYVDLDGSFYRCHLAGGRIELQGLLVQIQRDLRRATRTESSS